MRFIFILFFSFMFLFSNQLNAYDENLKPVPDELKAFILPETHVLEFASADLNNDKTSDYVLILQKNNDKSEGSRTLFIIIRDKNNLLKVVKQNNKIVYCEECGGAMGDPFQDIEVKPGKFSVSHYGGSSWRWTNLFVFAYSRRDNTWQLVSVEETSFHASDPEKTEKHHVYKPPKNFGKIDVSEFDPEKYLGVGAK
jgi:hypothetical protein